MSYQWGSQKLLQGLVSHELTAYLSVFYLFLTQWIIVILPKGLNQVILNKTTLLNLAYEHSRTSFEFCWMWIFPWIKLSWYSCSVRQTNLDDSIDSSNFFVTGYLPLIRKDSIKDTVNPLQLFVEKRQSFNQNNQWLNNIIYHSNLLAYFAFL